MLSEFLSHIADYLNENINGLTVKATPSQIFAGISYDLMNDAGCILINGEYGNFDDKSKNLEDSNISTGMSLQHCTIRISIGIRNLADNFELENRVEEVISKSAYIRNAEFSPLIPVTVTPLAIDGNSVQWKTIVFASGKILRKKPIIIGV